MALVEEIESFEHNLDDIKQMIKKTPRKLDWDHLPTEHKFEQLKPSRKVLMDTVKMIAYRAETAMVNIVREQLARPDDARALIRDLCACEADILPDENADIVTIQVHSMANPRSNRAVEHLLDHLNSAAINYPGTKLGLVYTMAVPKTDQP